MPDQNNDSRENSRLTEGTTITHQIDVTEQPSEAVVRAVSSFTNTASLDLDPLYDVVDPDHLDRLLDGAGNESRGEGRSVSLSFNGCRVTVTEDTVHVRERDEDPG